MTYQGLYIFSLIRSPTSRKRYDRKDELSKILHKGFIGIQVVSLSLYPLFHSSY